MCLLLDALLCDWIVVETQLWRFYAGGRHQLPIAINIDPIRELYHLGKVINYDSGKGVGFIAHPSFPNNVYFHHSYISLHLAPFESFLILSSYVFLFN
jgi:hypothetical protein